MKRSQMYRCSAVFFEVLVPKGAAVPLGREDAIHEALADAEDYLADLVKQIDPSYRVRSEIDL